MPTVVEGDFEWDSAKAESNLAKHGVSFPEAATVFADPFSIYLDDGSGTGNMVVIGKSLRERLLYVVHLSAAIEIGLSAHAWRRLPSETCMKAEANHESRDKHPKCIGR